MALLPGIGEERRAEDGNAGATGTAHAVIGDAARSGAAQLPAELLPGAIVLRVMKGGVIRPLAADIVQVAIQIGVWFVARKKASR